MNTVAREPETETGYVRKRAVGIAGKKSTRFIYFYYYFRSIFDVDSPVYTVEIFTHVQVSRIIPVYHSESRINYNANGVYKRTEVLFHARVSSRHEPFSAGRHTAPGVSSFKSDWSYTVRAMADRQYPSLLRDVIIFLENIKITWIQRDFPFVFSTVYGINSLDPRTIYTRWFCFDIWKFHQAI